MKKTNKKTAMTSFYDDTVKASLNHMTEALGEPDYHDNDTNEKTQNEWEFETDNGDVFTVYDWKEYRKYTEEETIEWHIGAKTQEASHQAKAELLKALELPKEEA